MEEAGRNKSEFSQLQILIVEDDPINIMILEKMLRAKKIEVLKAFNGNQAIKLCDRGITPDIIFLDLEMPEMNGYATIEKIRDRLPSVPVIACTASIVDRKMQALLHEKGFIDAICKPFKYDILYKKIQDVLQIQKT